MLGYSGKPKMMSAEKRTLIFDPPAILTVHLKRFEQVCQMIPVGFFCDGLDVTYMNISLFVCIDSFCYCVQLVNLPVIWI